MVFWWAPSFSFDGHVAFILVARWHFGVQLAFLLVATWHLAMQTSFILLANCHIDRQPAFILVATWHLLWWAAGVSFRGHFSFWVPPAILVGTL